MAIFRGLLIYVATSLSFGVFSQTIQPFQNWDEQIVESFEGISCWDISTDKKGMYYIATTGGLIEFDGSTTTNLASHAKMPILKSILIDKETIYYSDLKRDGFCLFDESRVNLSFNNLPENTPDQAFSSFSKILACDSNVYFMTDQYARVFSKEKKGWRFIKAKGKQTSAFIRGSELYAYQTGMGLFILRELDWVNVSKKIPDDPQQVVVTQLFGQIAAVTETSIFFLNAQSGEWKRWNYIPLKGENPTAISELDDHSFIVTTDKGSVHMFSRSGSLIHTVVTHNKAKIRSVFIDEQDRIWIPNAKGLSFFQLNYPLFRPSFSNSNIAESAIFSITGLDSLLFIGLGEGEIISLQLGNKHNTESEKSIKIPQLGSQHDLQLQVIAGDLFITHVKKGLYYYNPKTLQTDLICKGVNIRLLELSTKKNKLLIRSAEQGLFIIEKKNGAWKFLNTVLNWNIKDSGSSLEGDDNCFWFVDRLDNNESMLHRVKLNEELTEIIIDQVYGKQSGLPDKIGRAKLFYLKGTPHLATSQGIYYYKKNTDAFYLNKDLTDLVGEDASDMIFEDHQNNLWLIPNGKLPSVIVKEDNGAYTKYQIPVNKQQKRVLDDYILDSGITLLGTLNGILGVSPQVIAQNPIHTQISRVYSNTRKNDSIQYHPSTLALTLPVLRNSIHFRLATNHFIPNTNVEYQYRLKHEQTEWSAWSANPLISFPNLPDGNFIFEARARDPFGKISKSVFFSFTILPPWYRTLWAYLAYSLLLSAAIIAFIRWRTYSIKRYNVELENEVASRTEEIITQKELIENQAKELARLNELKTRFLTETAHELRTPLTLTLAPLYDVLDQKNQLPKETLDQLRISEKNGRKLLELIEEILTVSRLENSTLPTKQSIAFPERVIRDLVECYSPFFIEKRIKINYNFQIRPDLCLALDWAKYRKIVSNLIHNAIKFTPEEGDILIHVQLLNSETSQVFLETSITDTGEGIAKNELDNIFLRFYKQNQLGDGFGIGLSLVKDLAELMGGSIHVRSELSKGSVFTLKIPAKLEVPIAYVHSERGKNNAVLHAKNQNILLPKEEQKYTVIVIEDNEELRSYLSKMLALQYEVVDFESAYKALDWLQFNNTDLIISDWMMSGMDGLEFYTQLKASQSYRLIPFILLTAKADAEQRMEALMLGIDEYITKPFAPKELMMRIKRLLDLKENRSKSALEPNLSTEDDFSLQEKFVKTFKEYVQAHMGETSIKLTDLCEALAVSERQLHYKVKSLTGMTPGNLVREIKLQHVRRLFEKNKLGTVAEGAYAIGFNNINHFSKLFEKRFGKKPSAYFKDSGLPA